MIRPFTFLTALLFVLSGAYLFAVKHRAQMMDDQIAQVAQATRLDEQRIRVLQAQWALEIDPSRLSQLAARFTPLQPMRPDQLVTLAALRQVLPPAGRAPAADNPSLPMPPALAQATPAQATASAQATPAVAAAAAAPPAMPDHVSRAPQKLASVEALLRTLPVHRHHGLARREAPGSALYTEAAPPPLPNTEAVPPLPNTKAVPPLPNTKAVPPLPSTEAPPPLPSTEAAPPPVPQMVSMRAMPAPVPPPLPMEGGSMLGMAQTGQPN